MVFKTISFGRSDNPPTSLEFIACFRQLCIRVSLVCMCADRESNTSSAATPADAAPPTDTAPPTELTPLTATTPTEMTVVSFDGAGGPEVIRVGRGAVPVPGPGEVLIRVHACGVNPADVSQREGNYRPPEGASEVPGLEVAGEVVGHGRGVNADVWPLGECVVALIDAGGYAEYAIAPVAQVLRVPRGISMVGAAALIEVAATVYSNLAMTARLQAGETVLVHGASGGIGTFALQWLSACGHTVYATASTAEKCRWARERGATEASNYRDEDFVERTKQLTDGRGVDVVLDVVGGAYLDRNLRCLATDGRMVTIGLVGGRKAELDMGRLMIKRLSVHGTTLRARPADQKAAIVAAVGQHVWPLIADGRVTVPVDAQFPLEQARDAHEYLARGEHFGKIVLTTHPGNRE